MSDSRTQAVKDAMADAETLLNEAERHLPNDAGAAFLRGHFAEDWLRADWCGDVASIRGAVDNAQEAARAAFRAVPGLRGEEGGAR